ncbi:hypothetical protein [Virgibacillus kimchii]
MSLETRILNASECYDMMQAHNAFHDTLVYGDSSSAIEAKLAGVALGALGKLFGRTVGSISSVAVTMYNIARNQNASAISSYIRGGALAFQDLYEFLQENSGYHEVEAQFLMMDFWGNSTNQKYVQGNRQNPESGYVILRIRTDAGWIT